MLCRSQKCRGLQKARTVTNAPPGAQVQRLGDRAKTSHSDPPHAPFLFVVRQSNRSSSRQRTAVPDPMPSQSKEGLNEIDTNLPAGFDVHLVMGNYGTHKVTKVQAWLARHLRYHFHFTPTSGSWLNLVERLFAEVTERCVRRGSHTAVRALETAMLDCLDQRNRDPKLFIWTASADQILGKVERLCKRISNSGH